MERKRSLGGANCVEGCKAHADVDIDKWAGGPVCEPLVDTVWVTRQDGKCHCVTSQEDPTNSNCRKREEPPECKATVYFRFTLPGNAIACAGGGVTLGPGGIHVTRNYGSLSVDCDGDHTTSDGESWSVFCAGTCGQTGYDYKITICVSCPPCPDDDDC